MNFEGTASGHQKERIRWRLSAGGASAEHLDPVIVLFPLSAVRNLACSYHG